MELEAKAPKRGLRLDPIAKALTPQPIAYAIREVLLLDSLANLIGAAGTFKSFVAVDWICCIATGTPWCGNEVRQGPVLLFLGEGRGGIPLRFGAWSVARQVEIQNAPIYISNEATALTDGMRAAELVAVVAEFQRTYGSPVLIVFDTLNRNFGPADENSTADMTRGIGVLDELRAMTGACILLLHHSGHADKSRARGSSVLIGAVDTEWRTGRDDDGTVRLENSKMKEGPEHEGLAFRIDPVNVGINDDAGEPVASIVLRPAAYVRSPARGKAGRGKHQTTAVRLLTEAIERHRTNVERSGRSPDHASVALDTWRDLCAEAGIDRRRFPEVLRSLINTGKVRNAHGFVELGEAF